MDQYSYLDADDFSIIIFCLRYNSGLTGGIVMDNWFLKASALVIVVISYLDSAINLFQFDKRGPVIFAASIFLLLWAIISHRKKGKRCMPQIPDLLATICFIFTVGQKYKLDFKIQPTSLFSQSLPGRVFCYAINHSFYYVFVGFCIFVVLNAVLSSYGWGITRLAKSCLFRIGYILLYSLLKSEMIFKGFKRYMENRKALSCEECDLLRSAVRKRSEYLKSRKESRPNRTFWEKVNDHFYFPVVFRKHAEKKSFMPKWLYNISLVQGKDIHMEWTNKPVFPRISEFTVNLTNSKLAIINNWGKRFLMDYYHSDDDLDSVSKHNMEINAFLSHSNQDLKEKTFSSNTFYRWGSAGTLPIIKYKGKKWIAFVYRDIYPKGWNLPLGASECELEKGRPGITAIREMLEELVVFAEPFREYHKSDRTHFPERKELYHPLLNSIEGETNYQASRRSFYGKQREIIAHTCPIEFGEKTSGHHAMTCYDSRTTMQIKVKDDNRKIFLPENVSTNCMVTVDNFEQGIECIKPVRFQIGDGDDLRMGEVDFLDDKWINNPVILIRYEALEEYFKSNEFKELIKDDSVYAKNDYAHGEGINLKSILSNPENYHLFGVQIQDREEYQAELDSKMNKINKNPLTRKFRWKEMKHLRVQKDYLKSFVDSNKAFFTMDEQSKEPLIQDPGNGKSVPPYYMCPAAWKSCYYYLSGIYKIEENTSFGE